MLRPLLISIALNTLTFVLAVDMAHANSLLVNTGHRPVNINTTVAVDDDLSTCISLNSLGRSVLKLPTGQHARWNMTVAATYSLPDSQCTSYDDVLFMVHASPPLHMDSQGVFQVCELINQELSNEMAVLTYSCTCQYGPCENVVIRSKTDISCGLLCDVNTGAA